MKMTNFSLLLFLVSCWEKDTGEVPNTESDTSETDVDTDTETNLPLEMSISEADVKISGEVYSENVGSGLSINNNVNNNINEVAILSSDSVYIFQKPFFEEHVISDASVIITPRIAFKNVDSGDVNGDGFGDILIGERGIAYEDSNYVYLIHGPITSSASVLDLAITFGGHNVLTATSGNVNDDLYDDVLVGSNYLSYLFYNPVSSDDIENADAVIVPEYEYDYLTTYLVDDLNGDVIGDIVSNVSMDLAEYIKPCTAYISYGPIYGEINLSNSDSKVSSLVDNGWLGDSLSVM